MRVVINAFNEAQLLPACLARIPRGTSVTLIDGAYAKYPHEVPWSTDGTCEIAERWGADVIRVTEPWESQIVKRSFMLTLAKTVFVLDADEILFGRVPRQINEDVGWVSVISHLYPTAYPEPRIFRVRDGWHYAGRHHWIYDADDALVASHRARGENYTHVQTRLSLLNARHWRAPGRLKDKSLYVAERNKDEGRFGDESAIGTGIVEIRDLPRVRS